QVGGLHPALGTGGRCRRRGRRLGGGSHGQIRVHPVTFTSTASTPPKPPSGRPTQAQTVKHCSPVRIDWYGGVMPGRRSRSALRNQGRRRMSTSRSCATSSDGAAAVVAACAARALIV